MVSLPLGFALLVAPMLPAALEVEIAGAICRVALP
jgi:hypothetical protein